MFTITIETSGNSAFDVDGPAVEVIRILRDTIEKLETGEVAEGTHRTLRDHNGNRVGSVRFDRSAHTIGME